MAASTPELLRRMSATLRTTIGPAVEEPFARTQAFMAAVVLEKTAGQLEAAADGAAADEADREALVTALAGRLPTATGDAVEALRADGSDRSWSRLVAALWEVRSELGDEFESVLGAVRAVLRRRLDRVLAYAS